MHFHEAIYVLSFATSTFAAVNSARPTSYASWMVSSIISRGQGIANSGAKTSQIEQGIFQSALRQTIEATESSSSDVGTWSAYLAESLQNDIDSLSNATLDASEPLDRLSLGTALLHQYKCNATGAAIAAISALKASTDVQPRNAEEGFWYYKAYPQWSYLDGMFSLPAWYIQYAKLYEPSNLTAVVEDVEKQFDLLWNHTFHPQDNLLVHGYDASKTASWADPITGASPLVWGRSLGWYLTGLLETLEVLPTEFYAAHDRLANKFKHLVAAIVEVADESSGVWWQVMDQGGRQGNYLESSSSALFIHGIMRGARLGYLGSKPTKYIEVGKRGWEYMRSHFVVVESNGTISWNETVTVCSLNSTASYEYYVSQPINFNSLIGSSAFVLASLEYERLHNSSHPHPRQ